MSYTVKSREEAWQVANRLFPTDYMQDERSSKHAGYPIYESTADGNCSWISDLGNRLELNIYKGKEIESTNIWIEEEPEIIETKQMDAESVRKCCIKNNLYTMGTCREYDEMLNKVSAEQYSLRALYETAKDICEHSEEQTIENVMYLLNRDAVITTYEIR